MARRRRIRFFARGGRRGRPHVYVLLCVLAVAASVLLIDLKLRPLVRQLAVSRVSYLATRAINDAVSDAVNDSALQYGDLVMFEKDTDGKITALKTNMLGINRLKSGITNRVVERVNGMEPSKLSVPLGNILNGELLSGRGPGIPVRIVPVGMVDTKFSNNFSEAGINQTRHEIVLNVKVDIGVLLPGNSADIVVSSQVTIAETIIVGTVPGTFASFDSLGNIWDADK